MSKASSTNCTTRVLAHVFQLPGIIKMVIVVPNIQSVFA